MDLTRRWEKSKREKFSFAFQGRVGEENSITPPNRLTSFVNIILIKSLAMTTKYGWMEYCAVFEFEDYF